MFNFTIFKTEFRLNLKLALIWTLIFAGVIVLNLSLFDSIKDQQQSIDELLKSFPPEFMKAFSISTDSFATVEGYFSSKNLSIYVLAFSVLAVYLGSTTIGREISNRTITFLASKPLSRLQIYLSKTAAAAGLLLLADMITCLLSFVASRVVTSDHTAAFSFFFALFLGAWLMQLLFLGIGQVLSIWLSDSQAFLLGTGLVFMSWIVDIISALPGIPNFVKYFSPFHYVNADFIRINHMLGANVVVLILVALAVLGGAMWSFLHKDLDA